MNNVQSPLTLVSKCPVTLLGTVGLSCIWQSVLDVLFFSESVETSLLE